MHEVVHMMKRKEKKKRRKYSWPRLADGVGAPFRKKRKPDIFSVRYNWPDGGQ